MAKTNKTAPLTAGATVGTAPGVNFEVEYADELPASRAFGGKGRTPDPIMEAIRSLAAPSEVEGKMRYPNLFIPIEPVAATITDPTERAKAEREAQVKLAGRLSSMARRITSAVAKDRPDRVGPKFTTSNGEKNGAKGVRIFRAQDAEVKARAPKTAAAPATNGGVITPPAV